MTAFRAKQVARQIGRDFSETFDAPGNILIVVVTAFEAFHSVTKKADLEF